MLTQPRRAIAALLEHEQLVMITISTVLVMVGQGVIAPVLPLFARRFDVGTAAVGLTLSSFGLARLVLNVPLGVLSDRHGRRVLLVWGPLITAIGMVGSGLSADIYQLVAWRFVAGAGSAMYMTGAQLYLADISTPANRARFIGTNQGALLLGVSIGPAVGGVMAEVWGLRAPFIVAGVAALVAMVYSQVRLPETLSRAAAIHPREGGSPAPARHAWVPFLRSKDFVLVALVMLAIFFTRTASQQTIMPLFGAAKFGLSTAALGGIFTAMALINVVLVVPAAMIADRFGRKWSIIPSGLLVAGSLFLMAGSHTVAMFIGAAMVLGVSNALSGPAPAAYAVDIAPLELRGLAIGLSRSAGDVGFMIGPPLLGALADASSFSWALVANGILIAAVALLFLFARETVTPRGRAPARAPVEG